MLKTFETHYCFYISTNYVSQTSSFVNGLKAILFRLLSLHVHLLCYLFDMSESFFSQLEQNFNDTMQLIPFSYICKRLSLVIENVSLYMLSYDLFIRASVFVLVYLDQICLVCITDAYSMLSVLNHLFEMQMQLCVDVYLFCRWSLYF